MPPSADVAARVLQHLGEDTLVLDGKPVSKDALVGFLQQYVDAAQASTDAHAAWLQAVGKERHTIKVISAPYLGALQHYVAVRVGTNSDEYRAFGFQAPRSRAKSPEAAVVGAAKMRARARRVTPWGAGSGSRSPAPCRP